MPNKQTAGESLNGSSTPTTVQLVGATNGPPLPSDPERDSVQLVFNQQVAPGVQIPAACVVVHQDGRCSALKVLPQTFPTEINVMPASAWEQGDYVLLGDLDQWITADSGATVPKFQAIDIFVD